MELLAMLGRTPELGEQELLAVAPLLPFAYTTRSIPGLAMVLKPVEGRYGHDFVMTRFAEPHFREAIMTLQQRLGGTVRLVWGETLKPDQELLPYCHDLSVTLLKHRESKWNVGVSIWGRGPQPYKFAAQLKKGLAAEEHSVRTVTAQVPMLNGAQLLHNKLPYLTFGQGLELLIMREKTGWWVGVTLTAQNIADYTKRDFGVPKPDPVSGMLPPKLAQSMINLAVGAMPAAVYDPFCGNGRIVLEAALMGLPAYGSDIIPTKVAAAQENLRWLAREYNLTPVEDAIWEADATRPLTRTVPQPWYLVGEPYLGPPLRQPLPQNQTEAWLADVLPTFERFFATWATAKSTQRPKGFLLVFPRVKTEKGGEISVYTHLVDRLAKMGYNSDILFCYDRPDSIVRRDLVKLTYSS